MVETAALLWPIIFTGVSPFAIWLCRRNINARETVSFIAGFLTFITMLSFAPRVLEEMLRGVATDLETPT